MQSKGKITKWNDEKGYGFISPFAGGKQVFVHVSAFSNRGRRPEVAQVVTYTLSSDKQGRPCAINAYLAGDRPVPGKKHRNELLPIIFAALFMLLVTLSAVAAKIPVYVFAVYVLSSLLSYVMYASDKSAALKGAWRTKENSLHFFSLIGGWPGALIAQQRLRHKTKKAAFRFVFWITVGINIGFFIWIQTRSGAEALRLISQAIA
jgi:uncharacterized membrane protein YsdA (DUF1294 family)/cold shock CspA family protein